MVEARLIYWDANVFIHYLNNDPDKIQVLQAILEEVQKNNKDKIVTSVLSKVEVAWVASEKLHRALSLEEEEKIDGLWNDTSVIEMIDFSDDITHIARSLMRRSMIKGWKLKIMDAIHLASAEWVTAIEMQTYDDRLYKYSDLIGISVKEPAALQPKLF